MNLPITLTPERWIVQLFSARAAAQGGVLRRSVADVERLVGRDRFLQEIRRRGFRVIENAGQFVIFCNTEPVEVLHRTGAEGKFLARNLQIFWKRFAALLRGCIMSARPAKHSLTLRGHRTSVSLEPEFWQALREIAGERGLPLNTLAAEIDAARGADTGLASAIRVHILLHFRNRS